MNGDDSMDQQWYYSQNGQKHGPISSAELKQLAAAGKLQPTDLIWKEGMAKWAAARSVKGLFPAEAPSTPAAPAAATASKAAPGSAPARVEEVVEAQPAASPPPLSAWVVKWKRLSMPAKVGILGGAGAFLLLVIAVPVLLLAFSGRSSPGGAKGGRSDEPVVDIETMVTDYLADEHAADAKYKGRTLRFAGSAWEATGKTSAATQARLATSGHPIGVLVEFVGQSKDQAWKRRGGRSIKFRGTCQGIERATITAIRISDCEFEDGGEGGGGSRNESKPVASGGYQPGKLTRLETYNLICQVTRNKDFKKSSFSGFAYTGQDGRRYVNVAQQVDYATWVKTFGDIAVEDFTDEDGNVLTKQPGAAWGKWTLQCSDGQLTVIGCVMEASQSRTKRKRVQITKVGLF